MLQRARHHYYYPVESYAQTRQHRHADDGGGVDPSLCVYARIVRWLHEAVGPNDPRGFDPQPLFQFACRYRLLHKHPADIYREYVAYQCTVYAEAAARLGDSILNDATFADLQQWYEDENEHHVNAEMAGWKWL